MKKVNQKNNKNQKKQNSGRPFNVKNLVSAKAKLKKPGNRPSPKPKPDGGPMSLQDQLRDAMGARRLAMGMAKK